VKVALHPEVRVGVTINVARTAEEADRQARGENVIMTEAEQARVEAEAMFENPNAGKGLDDEEEAAPDADAKPKKEKKAAPKADASEPADEKPAAKKSKKKE
jgi:large subunit ribosomal protein L9